MKQKKHLVQVAVIVVIAISLLITPGVAISEDFEPEGTRQARNSVPNLEGTWIISIEDMCLPGGYGSGTGAPMVITNQIGRVFEGYFDKPDGPVLDPITGVIFGRTVAITDVDYDGTGMFEDASIFTGKLLNPRMIVGTYFSWDMYKFDGSCTGYFRFVKEDDDEEDDD